MTSVAETSVRKSITVNTSVERAFEVFTSGFDGWWPRTHNDQGRSRRRLSGKVGGRCYRGGGWLRMRSAGLSGTAAPPRVASLKWQSPGPDARQRSRIRSRSGRRHALVRHRHLSARPGASGADGRRRRGRWGAVGVFKAAEG